MKRVALFSVCVLFGCCALLPGQIPGIRLEKKIYKQVQGYDLQVDMFSAEALAKTETHPAIAFFHGGGWSSGNPAEFHEAWADRLMGERREEIWSISPHHNLKPGLPPVIEFHGEEDCMVPIWVVRHFINKAESMGNRIELIPFEGRRHYLGDGDDRYGRYYDEEVLERTDRFLQEHGFMGG